MSAANKIEQIVFSEGTVWNELDINEEIKTIKGSQTDDNLHAVAMKITADIMQHAD